MGEDVDNERLLTARLSLRRPGHVDIDAIYRIHRDARACAHNPSDMLNALSEAEDLYVRWDKHWNRYGIGYWVLRPRGGHRPEATLGFCGLKLMQFNNRELLNLFYRLDPLAWGDGVATEAATAVVALGDGECSRPLGHRSRETGEHRVRASRDAGRAAPGRAPRRPRRRRTRLDLHNQLGARAVAVASGD